MANGTATNPAAAASASAAAAAKKLKAAAKLLRYSNNEDVTKYFSAGICGIILLFTILHWTRFFYKRARSKQSSKILGLPIAFTRVTRKLLIRRVPGFISVGHVFVFLGFTAVVLGVTLAIDWDRSQLQFFGHRLGWLATATLFLVIFLSLKNTPLAILTAYSYEKLNFLHQVAGYSLIAFSLSHTVVMLVAWGRKNNLSEFLLTKNVMGIVAGSAMIVIFITATILRSFQYELFHIIHITMAALILITSAMHRPDYPIISKIMIIASSLWIADRLLRIAKLLFYSFGNNATITPLPHGGTRITLQKTPIRAVPGTHCFLWIPSVRTTELHPFTVMSAKPFEMVVAAYDGFTRDLHTHAVKAPGKVLMASVDGPYGTVPDFTLYDKILFIAGGSGASFTCGAAVDIIRKLGDQATTSIEFVWVMKEEERIEWFAKELEELIASPRVHLRIYSTHPLSSLPTQTGDSTFSVQEQKLPTSDVNSAAVSDSDLEKQPARATTVLATSLNIHQGRPNVFSIISETVASARNTDRVVVAVCGPGSMMADARTSVAENIKVVGPSLELHSEHFGW